MNSHAAICTMDKSGNLTESPCLFQPEVKFVSFKHRFHYVVTNKLCQQMFGGASGKMRQAAVTVQ